MAASLEEVGAQPGGDAIRRFLQVAHNDDGTLTSTAEAALTDLTLGSGTGGVSGDTIFKTNGVERGRFTFGGVLKIGSNPNLGGNGAGNAILVGYSTTNTPTGLYSAVKSNVTAVGTSRAGNADRTQAFEAFASDGPTTVNKTVSGAINNGSGIIRLTVTGHGLPTGAKTAVYGVTGTTEANGYWVITVIDANTVDLQGSTFTNAYVSGGTLTNRPDYYCYMATVQPTVDRGLLTGTAAHSDDVGCYVAYNNGTGKATDCFYIGHNSANFPTSSEFNTGFTIDANADYGIRLNGTFANYGIDLYLGTFTMGAIRLPDSGNIVLGTGAGTKIGTAATQKMAFFGSTPVVQPSAVGTATGYAAGSTAVTFHSDDTYTGNTGATAYTINGIVAALKNLGLIAA